MNNEESMYSQELQQLEKLKSQLQSEACDIEEILNREMQIESTKLESNLDVYDIIFAIIFGLAGAMLSTNEEIAKFSDQIHKHASGKGKNDSNTVQEFLGELLTHHGDAMDIPNGATNFLNRNGENAYGLFHRLLWGHDILSTSGDNPFSLLCNDNGLIKGVAYALRHLIADTFSKQGLPLPGSSYLDFQKENGKTSNYLIAIAQRAASESGEGASAQQYYSHAFTIRMQDVATQGLMTASAKAYFYFRKIKNKIRQTQYKVILYSVNFFTHALIGAMRQGGFPYINWPSLTMIMKEMGSLFFESNKKTRALARITDNIIEENNLLVDKGKLLERKVLDTGEYLKSKKDYKGFVEEYFCEEQNTMDLIDIFEEE